MKRLLYPVLALSLLAAPTWAQRMSNANAPTVGQFIEIPDKGRVELTYASISWAQGRWEEALKNEETRGQMRTMVNQSAADQPLGSLKTTVDLLIGEQRVPAGSYRLAFMLDDNFKWEIVLTADGDRFAVPLAVRPSMTGRKRLMLSLMAGDEDFTGDLMVAFGNRVCQLPIAIATPEEPEEVARPRGIINTRCPLMDDPVVKDWVVTYKGYNIGFCCEICFEDWDEMEESERAQILKDLLGGSQEKVVAELTVLDNRFCPLMDEPVAAGFTVIYRQVQFNMCCADCTLEWEKLTTAEKDELLESIR